MPTADEGLWIRIRLTSAETSLTIWNRASISTRCEHAGGGGGEKDRPEDVLWQHGWLEVPLPPAFPVHAFPFSNEHGQMVMKNNRYGDMCLIGELNHHRRRHWKFAHGVISHAEHANVKHGKVVVYGRGD